MSEYLVQRQSLENIADEIRVLSGTTEPLGLFEMATNVNDANDEVADQTDLIAQVANALQGKSVPGGSGASVETCTVTITTASAMAFRNYAYTSLDNDGNICTVYQAGTSNLYSVTLNDVVCGSVVAVAWKGAYTGKTQKANELWNFNEIAVAYEITAAAGETATIENVYAGGSGN